MRAADRRRQTPSLQVNDAGSERRRAQRRAPALSPIDGEASVAVDTHPTASRRKNEQREADGERQEHDFGCSETEIDDLDVEVAIVIVAVIVVMPVRALHGAVDSVQIEVCMDAAQLRPDQGKATDEQNAESRTRHRHRV